MNDEQRKMAEQLAGAVIKLSKLFEHLLPPGVEHTVLLHHPETQTVSMSSSIEREALDALMKTALERWANGEGYSEQQH